MSVKMKAGIFDALAKTGCSLAVGAGLDRESIQALETRSLWAILRSTNSMTERFANQLTWAKAELRRRGFAVQ